MTCPSCGSTFEEGAAAALTRKEASLALLKDWRVWAVAVGAMAAAGLVAGSLGFPGAGAGGGGAATGLFIATRMARLRKCPKCGAVSAA
jgi:hypothetical protein